MLRASTAESQIHRSLRTKKPIEEQPRSSTNKRILPRAHGSRLLRTNATHWPSLSKSPLRIQKLSQPIGRNCSKANLTARPLAHERAPPAISCPVRSFLPLPGPRNGRLRDRTTEGTDLAEQQPLLSCRGTHGSRRHGLKRPPLWPRLLPRGGALNDAPGIHSGFKKTGATQGPDFRGDGRC